MAAPHYLDVAAREREALDIVFRLGEATVSDIAQQMTNAPSPSALRTMLARLETKGHVRHRVDAGRNVYRPARAATTVRGQTLRRIVRTFFGGSATETVAALLDDESLQLGDDDLDRLSSLIDARRRRRSRP